jgi:branched-chain amino acid transport system permease protein
VVGIAPLLETFVRVSPEDSALIRPIIFGAVLLVIMRLRPAGLVPERHRIPRSLVRRNAEPSMGVEVRRVVVPALLDEPTTPETGQRPDPVLEVRQISKSFGGVRAVRDLTLQLREGEITALVGPNGAGKSTVFNLVTGELRPDSGSVILNGRDITGWQPNRVARAGMVRSFQDLRVFSSLTPIENVMMAGLHHPGENPIALYTRFVSVVRRDRQIATEAADWLDFVGVDPLSRVSISALSFAQQKQVAFARALATGAKILLLDEPLSGIEGRAADDMIALIERMRSLGHTICIVEHSIQAISRLADWAYFMEEGTVTAEGRVADLLVDPRLKEAYFGIA